MEEVIRDSGLLGRFPEIDLAHNKVGVFGKLVKLDKRVRDKDRVEIYRPLIADPKDVRRQRAAAADQPQSRECRRAALDRRVHLRSI